MTYFWVYSDPNCSYSAARSGNKALWASMNSVIDVINENTTSKKFEKVFDKMEKSRKREERPDFDLRTKSYPTTTFVLVVCSFALLHKDETESVLQH